MKNALSFCARMVRDNDPDRFLLSLFAPARAREDLWALFAFNHEIAKTREVVSETQLGLIRLQWWREEIGRIYETGAASEHEVLQPLARAIQNHDLPREDFETLIYAREFDLEGVLPANLEGLLHYVDFTATPLMRMAVKITGGDPEAEPVHGVAVNYALAGILRAVPFHAAQGRCLLPSDLLKKNDIPENAVFARRPPQALKEVVREIWGVMVPGIRAENRFLRQSQRLAMMYSGQLKRAGFDVYSPKMAIPPAFKELRLALFSGL